MPDVKQALKDFGGCCSVRIGLVDEIMLYWSWAVCFLFPSSEVNWFSFVTYN